VALGLTQPLT
jgi:hypothetical protein